jgi:hypothetical protein
MSVVSLLKDAEVREQLRRIAPPSPPRITAALQAPPLTKSYGTIGTAFDYALRFELERRNPHVRTEGWVAHNSLAVLPNYADAKVVKSAKKMVDEAEAVVDDYTSSKAPTAAQHTALAQAALRLAKLDAVYRAGLVDPNMGNAEPDNVQDILRLMEIAPFDAFSDPKTMWLNPTFGAFSHLVGGADCDLVTGDRLIDFKVTKNDTLEKEHVLQLVSYAILARNIRAFEEDWPEVGQVGIYFARHGHLWIAPASTIYGSPQYSAVEAWYFKRANAEFGRPIPKLKGKPLRA